MINSIQNNMINSYVNNYKGGQNNSAPEKKKGLFSSINSNPATINKLNYNPVTVGVLNGLCWTTVGMGLEMLWSKLAKSEVNTKVSLAVNGVFGLAMGIYAYKVAKREKAAQNNNS